MSPLGPSPSYLAKYNTYVLPGYVQSEHLPSTASVVNHQAPYADGSLSEYTGLDNKIISLVLKVWEPDYLTCKTEVQKAATMLRSNRSSFAPLYVQYSDKYYEAMTQSIRIQKSVPSSVRTLDYEVTFECKPWLTSTATYTISGVGVYGSDGIKHVSINTEQVSRTISDGGWTPTIITVTGTDVTISGYTATGDAAGFISISGAVTNMVIDSYEYTSKISGVNANDKMLWAGYQTYVGPGITYFDIDGASTCSIAYHNRWYI